MTAEFLIIYLSLNLKYQREAFLCLGLGNELEFSSKPLRI